jgi:hypothetical protein
VALLTDVVRSPLFLVILEETDRTGLTIHLEII